MTQLTPNADLQYTFFSNIHKPQIDDRLDNKRHLSKF